MTDEEIKKELSEINRKLDSIINEHNRQTKLIKESNSFGHFAKNWAGFYIASLIADETLGLNGEHSILGINNTTNRY